MIYYNPFATEREYTALLTYAGEGSTIGQRMQQGAEKEIPEYWEPWVSIERSNPGVLPRTLGEFVKQRETKLKELNPNEPNTSTASPN